MVYLSKCCHAEAVEDFRPYPQHPGGIEIYTCKKCKQECEVEDEMVCQYCHGDGVIATDETDGSGNVARGVESRKCICQVKYDDNE